MSDSLRLWLRVRHTEGVNRARFARLIARFGAPDAILGATAESLTETPGVNRELARAILDGQLAVDLDRELALIAQYRARLVTVADADYPENLRAMPDAPALLYFMGELAGTDRYAITVVGTRHATGYGRTVCEELAGGLADAGLTVVSGLALGVDTAAHTAALRHGGRTLAVMGCGLSRVYPPENEALAWKVTQHGALLGEYAMATPPDKYNFPERNEILAGLSLGVVVVEAPLKSGALLTARAALELGRSVYAVPGDVTRANSRGCNELIREGATLARDASDVIADLHDQLKDLLSQRATEAATRAPEMDTLAALSFEERQVYELAREDAAHFDVLYQRARERGADLDASRLATLLLQLEVKGLIRQAPGKVFVAEEPAQYRALDPEGQDRGGAL